MHFERPVWAEIDLSAVRANLDAIKSHTTAALCAVIKADAYGHGALAVAREAVAAGARYLGVAILSEALELRAAGFTQPILLLGHTPVGESKILAANRLTQTVYRLEQAQALAGAARALGLTAKVHLKIETGMNRLGVGPDEAAEMAAAVAALPGLELEGVYTHFAKADSPDQSYTRRQLGLFNRALEAIRERGLHVPLRHAANSAAIMDCPEAHFDMVRPGILIYGFRPPGGISRPIELKPVMRLKARLVMLKDVPAGEAVSYGCRYVTTRPSRLATLPLGYADGLRRSLSGRAEIVAAGRRASLVGGICMDQCMADVTGIEGLAEGDEVLVFGGPELPMEETAALLGSICAEVICTVGKRVPRRYLG